MVNKIFSNQHSFFKMNQLKNFIKLCYFHIFYQNISIIEEFKASTNNRLNQFNFDSNKNL